MTDELKEAFDYQADGHVFMFQRQPMIRSMDLSNQVAMPEAPQDQSAPMDMSMPSEADAPEPSKPLYTEDQLALMPEWISGSKKMFSVMNDGQRFIGSDKQAAAYGLDLMSEFNWNMTGPAGIPGESGISAPGFAFQVAALMSEEAGEENALTFLQMLNTYSDTATNGATIKRAFRGIFADPLTYAGIVGKLGSMGIRASAGFIKGPIKDMLMKTATGIAMPYDLGVKYPGRAGMAAGAGYGIGFEGGTMGVEQAAGYEPTVGEAATRLGTAGAVGAGAGGVLGKALGAGVPAAGQALRQGADVAGQAAEARMAERGPITDRVMSGVDPMEVIDPALAAAGKLARGGELTQPSLIALQQKPEIKTTGKRGVLLVEDVARYLEDQTIQRHGRVLDPIKNSNDLDLMINDGIEEVNFQLSKPISGETWYEDDVGEAIRLTSKIAPQVAEDEGMRVVSLAISALTSPGTRAGKNQQNSMLVLEELLTKGKMSGKNPENGKYFSGTRGPNIEKSIQLLQHMIDTKGIQGTADFLLSEKTVGELIAEKAASGLYKTPTVAGAKDSKKLGALIFGEKVGPFFLNLNGYKDTTADVWFTRSYNRHTGELTRSGSKDEPLVAMPRNMAERDVMKQWNRGIANAVGKNEQANQAILWYFEQNLYHDLGVKSARSESFADGAREFLKSRGIAE